MFLIPLGNDKKKIRFKLFDSESLKQVQRRILFAASIFILIYISIFIRLTDVMILSNVLSDKEEINLINLSIDKEKNPDQIKRGNIFDRNGILLASNIRSYSLGVKPKLISNKILTSEKLSKILGLNKKIILKKLNSKSPFIWLKRDISPTEHLMINNIGEIGLKIEKEQRRIYPQGKLTSHIVGFTDVDQQPLRGIERGLNNKLNNNEDVFLSIDIRLQNLINEELQEGIERFNAKGGVSIILDISNGQILASTSLPNFNPNKFYLSPQKNLFNSFSQGVYEMGSTFKPITMAIGYDSNSISDNDLFEVNSPIKIGKHSINDYKTLKGPLSVREIIVNSSNIGTARIAELIGKDIQKKYLKKFGLLEKQILEIPETGTPLFPDPWLPINTMTIGFGYGLSITPLQLCHVYSTLVNGGIPLKTTFLRDSEIEYFPRVISEDTSFKIRELLRAVILETKWTGSRAKVPGYEVAGKTGTAELVENSNYHKKANLSSFIGVFPISKPKYVILVMIRDPKEIEETFYNTTGAWVAAPIFSKIIKKMVNILGIPPTEHEMFYSANLNNKKLEDNYFVTF